MRTNSEHLLPQICQYLPPLWQPYAGNKVSFEFDMLSHPDTELGPVFEVKGLAEVDDYRTSELEDALNELEGRIQLTVAEFSDERVFLHAGVVAWQGRLILLPGRSFAGKSTLVTALLQAGAVYYSDEYALIDPQGVVHPYPRRLAIRTTHNRVWRPDAASFGSTIGHEPLTVGLVIFAQYETGAMWQPHRMTHGETVLAMFNNTVPAQRTPQRALSALSRVALGAESWQGKRGEAVDMVGDLLNRGAHCLPACA